MAALSRREQELLDFLESYFSEKGYSPSIRLIREAMGYRSNSPVQVYLERLEEKGYILREPGKARAIQLLTRTIRSEQPTGIYLMGTIAAGRIVESFVDCPPEPIEVSPKLNKRGNYALRVMGDSMIEAHICDGDTIVLAPVFDVQTLKPGSIVAARVEGQGATLKHFYLNDGIVTLQPANAAYPTVYEDATRVQVQGVLVGVLREY